MPDTSAVLSEPRAGAPADSTGGGSAGAGSVAPEAPASESESGRGEIRDHSSRILKSLSAAAYKKYMQTGLLPPDVELKEDAGPEIGEGEKILSEMSPEERRAWRERGVLPERTAEQRTAAKTGADEGGGDTELVELSEKSPLAKIHSMTKREADGKLTVIKGKESETDQLHKTAVATMPERMAEDRGHFDAADHARTNAEWQKLFPLVPQGLREYLTKVIQPHLNAPWTFFREFVRNPDFRAQVVKAGFEPGKGNLDKLTKVIAAFDAQHAPAPIKRVSSAPAPASSISGKGTAPVNEVEGALRSSDFTAFRRAANAEEFSKRRR